MKKSYYIAVAVLGLLITTAAVSLATLAATSNLGTPPGMPPCLENQKEIRQALIDSDYNTWASAMQEKVQALRDQANKLESQINQETFNKLVEAQQLIQSGDTEGARAIFEELGMAGPFPGKGKGFQRGLHLGQRFNNFGDQQNKN